MSALQEVPSPRRPARPACTNHIDLFDRAADASVNPGYQPPVWAECVAICQTCPVLARCREWVLSTEGALRFGVAGGMTPPERARAARERGAA